MDQSAVLRAELSKLMESGSAHADFEQAVTNFPPDLRGIKPEGAPHTAWELLEHMRIAQRDMLEFSRDPSHVSPEWPKGYWPNRPDPPDKDAWEQSVEAFQKDNAAMRQLVEDPAADLYAPFAHGDGQTLLREALQVADHNAYHVGELMFLRRQLTRL